MAKLQENTKSLTEKKTVDVTLPAEIVDLLDIWAARGDISRNRLIGQMVRFGCIDVGLGYRLYRSPDEEILKRNQWHKPSYVE